MKILITGACGALGKAVRRVGEASHQFVLLDTADAVRECGGIQGSFTDEALLLKAAEGCDAIIHTAAMHGGWVGKASDQDFIRTNVEGAATLFRVALAHGIKRVVCSSTMEILVGSDWLAHGTAILDETFTPRPSTIYPVSKLQVEILGDYYVQNHGMEIIQLRYMSFSDLPIERWGHRLAAQYIHSDDAAIANLLAVTKEGLTNEVFNIGPDSPFTQRDIHEALVNPWNTLEKYWPGCRSILQEHKLEPNWEWFYPVTRITKAKQVLGWMPKITFDGWLESLGWKPLGQPVH